MKATRFTALLTALVLTLALFGGCAQEAKDTTTVYADKTLGFQLEKPTAGEEVAIMHTNMGDISIRFFPEAAPKAVENFKTLAKNGYYDSLIFHRVINNFMIQGGDPTGTGTGGESCWGGKFEDEFDSKLGNLRGSLAMANSGADSNGSQFFINQAPAETTAQQINYYQSYYDSNKASLSGINSFEEFFAAQLSSSYIDPKKLNEEFFSAYKQFGGNYYLDGARRTQGGHTVFGQVYDGMDVVDKIAGLDTNEQNRPNELVCIDSIELTTYQG